MACCCPESEDGSLGTSSSDAYEHGGTSDVAPLLGEGSSSFGDGFTGEGPGTLGDPTARDGSLKQSFPGGTPAGGRFGPSSGTNSAAVAKEPSKVQQQFDEILHEAGRQVIDCGGGCGINSTANSRDPGKRSAVYGKRLSSVAAMLASKHLRDGGGCGLWDAGGGHRAERMSRQPGELVLTEGDHLLVTEVAMHSSRVAVESTVRAHRDLIVPFGTKKV